VGTSTTNLTPNTGTLSLVLKPQDQRSDSASQIIDRLRSETTGIPGVQVTFQSVQDIRISTRTSRAPYQYTLTGTDTATVVNWAQRLATEL
uniref:efflux RND transporter permease subunit n=2 Tax=Pseudomonadota TaxID=1224 RepID=UPI0013D33FA5